MALTQDEIDVLNHAGATNQKIQLGTVLSNIEGGVVAAGSISTAELADGVLTADAAGRLKMADSYVTAAKLVEIPFTATATLTAAAAATPIDIVATASVPAGKKIYITGMLLNVDGATAWADATATVVTVQDKAGSPVLALTVAKAQLTGNAVLNLLSTGVTLAAPILTGVGLTAAVGLTIKGDANFGAGSDIKVTISGFIKA